MILVLFLLQRHKNWKYSLYIECEDGFETLGHELLSKHDGDFNCKSIIRKYFHPKLNTNQLYKLFDILSNCKSPKSTGFAAQIGAGYLCTVISSLLIFLSKDFSFKSSVSSLLSHFLEQ